MWTICGQYVDKMGMLTKGYNMWTRRMLLLEMISELLTAISVKVTVRTHQNTPCSTIS